MSIFNDKSLRNIADVARKIMEAEASKPKTEKEKSLAALGHPKDKITHKDVLIGRGVLKKEDAESIDEMSHQAKTTMKHIAKPTAGEKKAAKDIKPGVAGYRDRIAMLKSAEARGGLKEEENENEEVELDEEQLDELSKDTVASYAGKAGRTLGGDIQALSKAKEIGQMSYPQKSADQMKATLKKSIANRKAGLDRAEKRLSKNEEVELTQEGWKEMMAATKERAGPQPSGDAGVKKGTRYGGGRQKDEPEHEEEKPAKRKYGARQNFKRSTRVNESFTELLQKYDEEGLKAFVTLEEEPDNEQFTKELEDQKASMEGKKKQPAVAAAATQGVKQMPEEIEVFDADEVNGTTVETIEERSLTKPESKKKEDIVMSMKKKMPGFKERYGERAKSVMYATATKLAKKD